MRKIIAITQLSLDGIMQAPGGPQEDPTNGFKQGGWAMSFFDEEAGKIIGEVIERKFDLLLGRRTYEIFSAYWPFHGDNPIGQTFNQATKYVVTRTLEKLDWKPSQRIGGDAVNELRKLKASDGPELHVWGSGNLLQTLITADLVDEHYVWVFPVILGKGKRLFENGLPPREMTLVKTQSTTRGILLNTYRPGGAVKVSPADAEPPSEAELARRKKWAGENAK